MSKHEQNAVLKPGDDTQVFIPSGSVAATVVKVLHNGQVVFRIPPIDCIVANAANRANVSGSKDGKKMQHSCVTSLL